MKYHDSVAQASDNLQQAVGFLAQCGLAAIPLNYSVAYEHIVGNNPPLSDAINQRQASGKGFDDFIMETFYSQWIAEQNDIQAGLISNIDTLLIGVGEHSSLAETAVNQYVEQLDSALLTLDVDDTKQVKQLINQLVEASIAVKQSQLALRQNMSSAITEVQQLRFTLDDIKAQRSVDTLTGLKNSQAIDQYMQQWLMESTSGLMAAITIDIDHFSHFNQRFGPLVGDAVLRKIAHRIGAYVKDSGLPMRVAGEAFLILLPDVDVQTAKEVAEQVRRGVEKIRFVSARSKRVLPSVTISLGVASYRHPESIELFIDRADNALGLAKSSGRNRVVADNLLF